MAENLVFFGVVLLFVAIVLIIIGSLGSKDTKYAFGGFIGPIPFGFANDPKMLWAVVGIMLIVALLFIFNVFRFL